MLNEWHKKEKPVQGMMGMGGGATGYLSGGAGSSTYGLDASDPALSAKDMLANNPGVSGVSGDYFFTTPNGVKQLYADMSTDGGGWTRFARTNVSNNSSWNVRSDYGLSGQTPSTEYCAWDFKNNRDSSSNTGECEYMISMNNGAYKFKISTLYLKGTNTYSNRTASHLSGSSTMNTYFTESELNNNEVGYWDGSSGTYSRGDVGQPCKQMQLQVNSWSGNFHIGQYSFRTSGSGSRCSDWCGGAGSYGINKRLVPYMTRSESCYSGYSPGTTNSVTVNNCEVYFREK